MVDETENQDNQQEQEQSNILDKARLFRSIDRIKKDAKPLQPLWGNFLYKKAITSIVGDPGAGKTTFGYELGGNLCLGKSYLDIPPEEKVSMVYMDFESADSLVASRGTIVFKETPIPNFIVYNTPDFYLTQVIGVTIEYCRENHINILAIDNQTTAFATRDENDNAEAAKQMKLIRQLANAIDAAVILFHHTSKANLSGTRKGTGAFARARLADVCVNINNVDEEKRDVIYVEMVKNRFDDSEKVLWYLKKEEGSFSRVEPPLGGLSLGEARVNTMIYRATNEVLSILRNGNTPSESPVQMKFHQIVSEMIKRGFSENWADMAVRKLKQQNRISSPVYGYYALRKF